MCPCGCRPDSVVRSCWPLGLVVEALLVVLKSIALALAAYNKHHDDLPPL